MLSLDLPYAVYGTLRLGMGNDRLWHGIASSEHIAWVDGYRLVSNGYFPYALPDPQQSCVVEVLVPNEGEEYELRQRLNHLEGYPALYGMTTVGAQVGGSIIECAMYVPTEHPGRLSSCEPVIHNDWREHMLKMEMAR